MHPNMRDGEEMHIFVLKEERRKRMGYAVIASDFRLNALRH